MTLFAQELSGGDTISPARSAVQNAPQNRQIVRGMGPHRRRMRNYSFAPNLRSHLARPQTSTRPEVADLTASSIKGAATNRAHKSGSMHPRSVTCSDQSLLAREMRWDSGRPGRGATNTIRPQAPAGQADLSGHNQKTIQDARGHIINLVQNLNMLLRNLTQGGSLPSEKISTKIQEKLNLRNAPSHTDTTT
eukprot:6638315-Pyramimonas_sp.AAC.1